MAVTATATATYKRVAPSRGPCSLTSTTVLPPLLRHCLHLLLRGRGKTKARRPLTRVPPARAVLCRVPHSAPSIPEHVTVAPARPPGAAGVLQPLFGLGLGFGLGQPLREHAVSRRHSLRGSIDAVGGRRDFGVARVSSYHTSLGSAPCSHSQPTRALSSTARYGIRLECQSPGRIGGGLKAGVFPPPV
jgi:hypothetical protein